MPSPIDVEIAKIVSRSSDQISFCPEVPKFFLVDDVTDAGMADDAGPGINLDGDASNACCCKFMIKV